MSPAATRDGPEAASRFFASPVLNSPYEKPGRHWQLEKTGQPTDRILAGRRPASPLSPVPKPRKQAAAPTLGLVALEETGGEIYRIINRLRRQLDIWRDLPPHRWQVTPETRQLLLHWRDSVRNADRLRPFFCQIEALETAIWLTEVAPRKRRQADVAEILDYLETASRRGDPEHPDLPRLALKLATGAGKTVVMAMLIAWQSINAARRPASPLFANGFLVVTPGLTIRDRLRVLHPQDPDSVYRSHDLVPPGLWQDLRRAEITVTNYHAFLRRETQPGTAGNKAFLHGRSDPPDTRETDGDVLQRVCSHLLGMRQLVVFNDEAHHCYRENPAEPEEEALASDLRKEANDNTEAARTWIAGIEMLSRRVRLARVFDLSATPFFLAGSGYAEGTLFPWTMSDFSLMDAIECGIVKLPRVPVSDNIPSAEMPVYRNLWHHVGKAMRKMGRSSDPRTLPSKLETALDALYHHYEQVAQAWERAETETPPCFIIVCNSTVTSKLVHDHVAGHHWTDAEGGRHFRQGKLPRFCNYSDDGAPVPLPPTLLIDSAQLESGAEMDKSFHEASADAIERFKRERVERSGNIADRDNISDRELLREVMNTVGKPGRLGASVRCVVSVSMLTEGWDANTVTHILGIRAFGTQLLCEQVVGRALRRQSYEPDADGRFPVEYADVLGVPFDFASQPQPATQTKPVNPVTVRAVSPERDGCALKFPRLAGYRQEFPAQSLSANFDDPDLKMSLTTDLVGPTTTRNEGIVGEGIDLVPSGGNLRRRTSLEYHLAGRLLKAHWQGHANRPALFADLQAIVGEWLDSCLDCADGVTPHDLERPDLADLACERIVRGIEVGTPPSQPIILPEFDSPGEGSTMNVHFTVAGRQLIWETDPGKSHIDRAVCDSGWEREFCRIVEEHRRTRAYVKNHRLGFEIPYCFGGVWHAYVPDFIVELWEPQHVDNPLCLVVEVKGRRTEQDRAKASDTRKFWLPAVNRHGGFGRWSFVELTDVDTMASDYDEAVSRLVVP